MCGQWARVHTIDAKYLKKKIAKAHQGVDGASTFGTTCLQVILWICGQAFKSGCNMFRPFPHKGTAAGSLTIPETFLGLKFTLFNFFFFFDKSHCSTLLLLGLFYFYFYCFAKWYRKGIISQFKSNNTSLNHEKGKQQINHEKGMNFSKFNCLVSYMKHILDQPPHSLGLRI